jgi:hypothetical protein
MHLGGIRLSQNVTDGGHRVLPYIIIKDVRGI